MKKVISTILISVLILTTIAIPIAATATDDPTITGGSDLSGALGDVNLDGLINSTDLQRLYAHLEGVTPLTNPSIGDINQDGLTNSTDLQRLYAHLEGVTPLQE